MTPNVSRYLMKYGVAKIIGDDLVQCEHIKMRRSSDSRIIQYTELHPKTTRELGFPWWVVHRAHLHAGLVEAARRHGVDINVDSRVKLISYNLGPKVKATTEKGATYDFDLLVGSDGLKSVCRSTLFPDAKPVPLTANAAYRAIVPYEKLFRELPETQELFTNAINAWSEDRSYIITYPISGGRDLNLVLEHHQHEPVYDVEDVDDLNVFFEHYKDYDPLLQKMIRLIPEVKRWPLLQLGPLPSWSSPQENVVLMGDAAHSMVNHMAQGTATSMEDGIFLGRVLHDVVHNVLSLPEAIQIYETGRVPRAWQKQQVSFVMGGAYMYDETRAEYRDRSSAASVPQQDRPHAARSVGGTGLGIHSTTTQAPHGRLRIRDSVIDDTDKVTGPDANFRGWNLWGAVDTVPSVWGYDAEADADYHVLKYLQEKTPFDPHTKLGSGAERKWTEWYLPQEQVGKVAKSRL